MAVREDLVSASFEFVWPCRSLDDQMARLNISLEDEPEMLKAALQNGSA